jgi:CO/xanthine dehydrogenase FAD-binding subunit
MTTLQELVESSVLKNIATGIISHAAKASAPSLAIRNAATIGGTLGAGLQSQSDLLTIFAALDVEVVLRSGSQTQINLSGGTSERPGLSLSGVTYKGKVERRVAFRSLDLERRPNELILEVVIPPVSPVIAGAFMRAGRTFTDRALINAVALVLLHEGKYQQVRLALGGLNMEPVRLQAIERHLEGKEITEPRMHQIWAALQAGINEFNPPSDESVSGVYRRVSGMSLAYRVLEEAMNVSQWRGMVASSEGRV